MTEAEATAMLVAIGDTVCSFAALWVSSTFAYLTVAYFVGKALSRFQNFAVSALYLAAAMLFGMGAFGHSQAWANVEAAYLTSYRNLAVSPFFDLYSPAIVSFVVTGTLLAFYFMYNVRQTAKAVTSS